MLRKIDSKVGKRFYSLKYVSSVLDWQLECLKGNWKDLVFLSVLMEYEKRKKLF